MNKALYDHLAINRANLHEELDRAIQKKNQMGFEGIEFGMKITSTTREKIFRSFVNIFKLLRYYKFDEAQKEIMIVSKRCKLHFYQLKKLNLKEREKNIEYITDIMKVCYSILLNSKIRYLK